MGDVTHYAIGALLVGAGATAFMDLMAAARRRLFRSPTADYALVGRWLAHVVRGRFHHESIKSSPAIRGERLIGWTAHYVVGIAFACLLLAISGVDWLCRPRLGAALIVGIGSVAAPFFIMQPGMGAGIAASRTPDPAAARVRSLVTHTLFGIGLYVSGVAVSLSHVLGCGP